MKCFVLLLLVAYSQAIRQIRTSQEIPVDVIVEPEKMELISNVDAMLDSMPETRKRIPTIPEIAETGSRGPWTVKERVTTPMPQKSTVAPSVQADEVSPSTAPKASESANQTQPQNIGTYIQNIENLQVALTGMVSDIDNVCDETKPSVSEPPKNPFLNYLQNITQANTEVLNSVVAYWQKVPGLLASPLQIPTLAPIKLPGLRRMTDESSEPQVEKDEKIAGLEKAVINTIEEMLPKLHFIESFPGETATDEQWEEFNNSIEFVTVRLRNKTIAQVLDKERIKALVEVYEKYLSEVRVRKLMAAVAEGKPIQDTVQQITKIKKC